MSWLAISLLVCVSLIVTAAVLYRRARASSRRAALSRLRDQVRRQAESLERALECLSSSLPYAPTWLLKAIESVEGQLYQRKFWLRCLDLEHNELQELRSWIRDNFDRLVELEERTRSLSEADFTSEEKALRHRLAEEESTHQARLSVLERLYQRDEKVLKNKLSQACAEARREHEARAHSLRERLEKLSAARSAAGVVHSSVPRKEELREPSGGGPVSTEAGKDSGDCQNSNREGCAGQLMPASSSTIEH